ncbi:hypothetical protein EVAR_34063_1 [Eumeta japonica]|uniref:Uncharacterized protein n=1 Tax=Eumeta variegata TaxID=151549 RepID=A0A4C1VSY8_EUMVA|nr:hypothetical protein EVAR_34063_1 [Eumeta japonica]
MAHIKNIHKAVYLEVFKSNNSAVTKDLKSDLSNPIPSTSKQDSITISESTVNEPQLPSTSTSSPMDSTSSPMDNSSEISTKNSQTDKKMDYDRELPFKRQISIESSFGEIYAYTSTGDKTKRINNAIMFMICKDNQPFR